eukprot:1182982-Prorocentrum_minimum.AAC.2
MQPPPPPPPPAAPPRAPPAARSPLPPRGAAATPRGRAAPPPPARAPLPAAAPAGPPAAPPGDDGPRRLSASAGSAIWRRQARRSAATGRGAERLRSRCKRVSGLESYICCAILLLATSRADARLTLVYLKG